MVEFTVVTGFFDIGRGEWDRYNRKLEEYFIYFENTLKLKVNMVIFIESKHYEFVKDIRDTILNVRTIICKMEIEELYMYQHLDRITDIQNSPNFALNHPNPTAPEICKPLYNVVVCNKMDFLQKATEIDKESQYFIWLDAGYTHGNINMSVLHWNPTNLFECKDKICMICLQDISRVSDDPKEFFEQYKDVIIGGFISGYRDTISKVRDMYYDLVEELYDLEIKDDDQYYSTMLAKRNPELYQLYWGRWYDAFIL